MLSAVTFDFWNTLFVPAAGTFETRAGRLAPHLGRPAAQVQAALAAAFASHEAAWRDGRHFSTAEVAGAVSERLGLDPSPEALDRLKELIETSGQDGGERPVAAAAPVLARLREAGLRLGVVSDTGLSPGWVLRRFLARAHLLEFFEPAGLAFSDEVGVPKPDPRIFQRALAGVGAAPGEAAHVGDLRFTDVAGARSLGMLSVRFRGWNDDPDGAEADAVIDALEELPGALGLGR